MFNTCRTMDPCLRGFRIKLDLSELICGELSRLWYYVDKASCKTIAQLKHLIAVRFQLKCLESEFDVRLQEFVIPGDESIDVLQPNDLLILRKTIQHQCHSPRSNIAVGLRTISIQHPSLCNSKQRCHSKGAVIQTHDLRDTGNTSNTEQQNTLSKKKKKKSKHKRSDSEENQEVANYLKTLAESKDSDKIHSKKSKKSSAAEIKDGDKVHSKKSKKSSASRVELPIETCSKSVNPSVTEMENRVSPEMNEETETAGSLVQDLPKKRRKRSHKKKNADSSFLSADLFNGHETGKDAMAYNPDFGTPRFPQPSFHNDFYSENKGKHIRFDENNASLDKPPGSLVGSGTELQISKSGKQTRNEESNRDVPVTPLQKTPNIDVPNVLNSSPAPAKNSFQNKDLSEYPMLVGHPRLKDIVAYKVLELSDEYMPKMSDYIVGEVIESDPSNKDVTIRFLTPMKSKPRRGKFELLEGDLEEEEMEEEIITTCTTVEWHFVVEARLLPDSL